MTPYTVQPVGAAFRLTGPGLSEKPVTDPAAVEVLRMLAVILNMAFNEGRKEQR